MHMKQLSAGIGAGLLILAVASSASARRFDRGASPIAPELQAALIWTGHYDGMIARRGSPALRKAIAGFQQDLGAPPSGRLTAEESRLLLERAAEVRGKVGFEPHQDAKTGLKMPLPLALVQRTEDSASGSRFVAPEGSIEIELFRFAPGERNPMVLFRRALTGNPDRKITYARMGRDWFVVSGTEGARRFYTRLRDERGAIVGFGVAYASESASTIEPVIVAMSNVLEDPGRAGLLAAPAKPAGKLEQGEGIAGKPEASAAGAAAGGGPDEPAQSAATTDKPGQSAPSSATAGRPDRSAVAPGKGDRQDAPAGKFMAVAFAIDHDGHLVAGARVAGCQELVIGEDVAASLVRVDPRNDLALLRAQTASGLEPLGFSDRPARPGDAVIVAAPGSAAYVSSGRINAIVAPDGDTTRLDAELPIRSDDGGAPVFNEQGAIIGTLAGMDPERARDAIAADRHSRSVVRAEIVQMFLAAQGISPMKEIIAAQDVAQRARKAAVPVRCGRGSPSDSPATSTVQR